MPDRLSPCKGCEFRKVGCHGKCKPYQDFRQRLTEENAKVYKWKEDTRIETTAWMRKNIKRKVKWK